MSTLPENSLSTREVIVNEALDQFAKYGIVETSIRSICGKLNQSTAAISYHFGSKEGLTKEVLEECLKRLSKSFDWFEMTGDFALTAERLCRHSVAHSKEMFVLYRFTFSQDTSFFSGFRNYLLNLRTRFCKYFTQEAQRRGVILE